MNVDDVKVLVFFGGLSSAFVFFFYAFIWEMVRWQKPVPDPLNFVLWLLSCFLCSVMLMGWKRKSKKENMVTVESFPQQVSRSREELEKMLFAAKSREEKLQILEELKHTK